MSYQVLARRWRPHNFATMVGQQHVVQALSNAFNQQRLHHAYLFTGTRGVGKTTLGRIIAKCLQCETGITATPCEKCDTCQSLDRGQFPDLIEIDAASRTQVEDTKEILDNVMYAPNVGRFKIYLIDEVHMLSKHSFNALLKTLEEPPEHVKFIFATTDPQKLPITVLSRCLQFHLQPLTLEQISGQLQHVLNEEHINFEPEAVAIIARNAEGSMRDGLSLLDQAIAYCNETINLSSVQSMLGLAGNDALTALLQAIADKHPQTVFDVLTSAAEQCVDYARLLDDIIASLHKIAILQQVADYDTNSPIADTLQQLASKFDAEYLQLCYQIALHGRRDLALTPTAKQAVEMTLLRMLAFNPLVPNTVQIATPPLGQTQAPTIANQPAVVVNKAAPDPTASPASKPQTAIAAAAPVSADSDLDWSKLLPQLKLTGMTLALAQHCVLQSVSNHQFDLLLDANQAPLLSDPVQARLAKRLSEYFGAECKLNITMQADKIHSQPGKANQAVRDKQQQAKSNIESDTTAKQLMREFNATIVPDSIQPTD